MIPYGTVLYLYVLFVLVFEAGGLPTAGRTIAGFSEGTYNLVPYRTLNQIFTQKNSMTHLGLTEKIKIYRASLFVELVRKNCYRRNEMKLKDFIFL